MFRELQMASITETFFFAIFRFLSYFMYTHKTGFEAMMKQKKNSRYTQNYRIESHIFLCDGAHTVIIVWMNKKFYYSDVWYVQLLWISVWLDAGKWNFCLCESVFGVSFWQYVI